MSIIRESTSIVHHTSTKEALMKILKNECFKVNYCTERIYVDGQKSLHIAVPMVSFADIKLSDYARVYRDSKKIEEETTALGYYGDYALCLSKEWARKNHVYPICYISKPGNMHDVAANYLLHDLSSYAQATIPPQDLGQDVELPNLASFCKHDIGYLERTLSASSAKRHKYAFYNEREYRYVPAHIPVKWNFFNTHSDYDQGKIMKDKCNKNLAEYLRFDLYSNVTGIVVKTEESIDELMELLNKMHNQRLKKLAEQYSKDPSIYKWKESQLNSQHNSLLTKIITTHQLLTEI